MKLFVILLFITKINCEFAELECPEDCYCHYFRINYVTDCSESNLTEIPYDEISPSVYILDLNGNEITEIQTFPEDFKIRRLLMADNKVDIITQSMFSGLKYLLDLDLSNNNISDVDPEAFSDSPGFITLELQNNPLVPRPGTPFLSCRSLLYLDLSDCNLTSLPDEFFYHLTTLNTLILANNPFVNVSSELFAPLATLEELTLRGCNITYLESDVLDKQHHLKLLDLSFNKFINVDWTSLIGNLYRLENFDLRSSGVKNLPDDLFYNNTWIRVLNLADNLLNDFDASETLGNNLKYLESLDLSNCKLKGPLSEDAFKNALNLKTLILSGNSLASDDLRVALSPLSKLVKLSLRDCSLTQLPSNTFHRFNNLEELDISHNPLNDAFIHLLQPLSTLELLDMSYSNLSSIARNTFCKMTSLKKLVLSGNPLGELESGLFGNLTRLRTLEIDDCRLQRMLNQNVFYNNKTYYELEELKMGRNPLTISNHSLLPKQLRYLNVLDISACGISYLPNDVFLYTRNLTKLILANNNLDSKFMERTTFLYLLRKLEYLDLSGNKLTYLSTRILKPTLADIKLTNNPWICDCALGEWYNWGLNIRGDLQHLIGFNTKIIDMSKNNKRREKGLLCNYDARVTPPLKPKNATRTRARPDTFVSKTWARYLRESGCEFPVPEIENITIDVDMSDIEDEEDEDNPRYFPDPILPSPQPIDPIATDKFVAIPDTIDDFQISILEPDSGVDKNGNVNHAFIVSVTTVGFILVFVGVSVLVFLFTRKRKTIVIDQIPLGRE